MNCDSLPQADYSAEGSEMARQSFLIKHEVIKTEHLWPPEIVDKASGADFFLESQTEPGNIFHMLLLLM